MSEVTIRVRDNGNLKVEGPVTLLDGEGNAISIAEGSAIFLCRCGQSKEKPFCDSSHRAAGFQSVVRASEVAAVG
jgi:CDGSH-type Zn-finger protein